MSFEEPLEQHQEPHGDAYTFSEDRTVRIYHMDSVVRERVHKTFGHQYAVKYKNGQHQWWKVSDVKTHFPELLKQFHDRKYGNVSTSGKSEQIPVPRRKPGRPPNVQKSGNKSTPDRPEQIHVHHRGPGRPPKRTSSWNNKKCNSPISKPIQTNGDTVERVSRSPRKTSVGNGHGSFKKRRSTSKDNVNVGASTSSQVDTGNDVFENEMETSENTENIYVFPSTQNSIPDISNVKLGLEIANQSIDQNLEADPYNIAEFMAETMTKFKNRFVGPVLKAKEVDKAEIEKWKLSYQEATKQIEDLKDKLNEAEVEKVVIRQEYETKLENMGTDLSKAKEELETVLQGVTINQEIVRQDKEENDQLLKEKDNLLEKKDVLLEEKDKRITSLKTENESLSAQKLETLRKIVGEGNYKDTDDEAALIQTALQRAQWLNQFVNAAKFCNPVGVTKTDPN